MSLSTHFSFYIFQLILAAKTSDIEFIIDDMTTILMKKAKRSNYIEKKTETIRVAKHTFRDNDEIKFNSSNNNKSSNNSNKKNREKNFVLSLIVITNIMTINIVFMHILTNAKKTENFSN